MWTDHNLLGHTWRTYDPVAEHTKWAREHSLSKRTYYPVFCYSYQKLLFEGAVAGDGFAQDTVRMIHDLHAPEDVRVELLNEYQRELNAMPPVDPDNSVFSDLYGKWSARLGGSSAGYRE
jgi:hypothetical protein